MTAPAPQGCIPTLTDVVDPAQLLPKTVQTLSESFLQHLDPVLAQCIEQATDRVIQNFMTRHVAHFRTELQEELTLSLRQAVLGALSEPAPTNSHHHLSLDVSSADTSSSA
jgi:hypothetical protein